MNVLVLGFNGFVSKTINFLDDSYDINFMYHVASTINKNTNVQYEFIEWSDAKYGKLYIKNNTSVKKSLSSDVFNALAHYEGIFQAMFMRINKSISYKDLNNLYLEMVSYWTDFLIAKDINLIISSNVPHEGFDFIIYNIAKYFNIKTLHLYTMPIIPQKTMLLYPIYDLYNQNDYFKDELMSNYKKYLYNPIDLRSKLRADISNYYTKYREDTVHSFTRSEVANFYISKTLLKLIRKPIYSFKKIIYFYKLSNMTFLNFFIKSIKEIAIGTVADFNSYYLTKLYNSKTNDFISGDSYVYFPLHYQPEASTNPLAGVFQNQLIIVDLLVKHLPKNMTIYIKEHPRISSNRNRKFYDYLENIPNVRLIRKDVNSVELIRSAVAIVTCSGSVGLEAIINEKPVLMFGSRLYQYAEGIFQIKSENDLKDSINEILNDHYKVDLEKVLVFLKTLESHSENCFIDWNLREAKYFSYEENQIGLNKLIKESLERTGILSNQSYI